MSDQPTALIQGVNTGNVAGHWGNVERPSSIPEQAQKREVLLVDQRGNAILVREPRAVGFRQP